MPAQLSGHAQQDTVEQALLDLNARLSWRTSVPIALVVALLACVLWPHSPHGLVVAWSLVNWLVLLSRHMSWQAIPKNRVSTRQRLRIAQLLSLLFGIVNASAVLFFPDLSTINRFIMTLVLAGVTTGGISTSAGHIPLYLADLCPAMGALMLGWAVVPPVDQDPWLGAAMVAILLMYSLTTLSLAKANFQGFKAGITKGLDEAHLNQQLRAALNRAEAANAAKTRFLASASHDLRQPLHSLSLFFATLRLQIIKPDNLTLLGQIDQALSALQSQMNTLLDMSKLDAGMVKLDWQSFALAPLLDQLKSAYQAVAQQKGLALMVSCPPDLLVNSDREQLCRVLRNLLDNAVKYTSAGEVRVHASAQGDQIKVGIEDTGCGISTVHHQQVFEEFFQVGNPERDRENGLGLGLPIVRRLSALLYLELHLQSALDAGTHITIAIPRGMRSTPQPPPDPNHADAPASLSMCRVLVLDDEAAVRAGMQVLLKRMGCEVLLAASTDEALAQAAQQTPDLVLADLRLRGQESGITAVRLLRQQHPNLPAIIITGDTAPDRMRQVEAAGLTVLHKPVAADALMSAIARSLDSDAQASPE